VATKDKKDEGAQFVRYFGPLLDALRGLGGSAKADEAVDRVAEDLTVPDEVLNETLPSGGSRFRNQVAWARFYLVREGLIDSSKHGVWSLTERGFKTKLAPEQARQLFLKWVKLFQAQRKKKKNDEPVAERIAEGTGELSKDYREEVLEVLLSLAPAGFERLSQRLLREAGFTQVVVTGQSGDGGIDGFGILQVNPLVSFKVLFQCKRYAKSVAPSQVRDFRGAMSGRADKGIIITTGTFTAEAKREATRDGAPPVELIDGGKADRHAGEIGAGFEGCHDLPDRTCVLQRVQGLSLVTCHPALRTLRPDSPTDRPPAPAARPVSHSVRPLPFNTANGQRVAAGEELARRGLRRIDRAHAAEQHGSIEKRVERRLVPIGDVAEHAAAERHSQQHERADAVPHQALREASARHRRLVLALVDHGVSNRDVRGAPRSARARARVPCRR
jgi:restriction system protein